MGFESEVITMDVTIRKAQISDNKGVLRLLTQIAELHHKGRPDIFKDNTKKYSKHEFFLWCKW